MSLWLPVSHLIPGCLSAAQISMFTLKCRAQLWLHESSFPEAEGMGQG